MLQTFLKIWNENLLYDAENQKQLVDKEEEEEEMEEVQDQQEPTIVRFPLDGYTFKINIYVVDGI